MEIDKLKENEIEQLINHMRLQNEIISDLMLENKSLKRELEEMKNGNS